MDKETLKEYGFELDSYSVVGTAEEGKMAMDAALISSPNTGIPVEYLTFFDNRAIDVLTAKRAANEVFNEYKAGTRADLVRKFRVVEGTGYTQPYSDYSDNGKSDVNYNYPMRENYLFETVITYGDQEVAETSKAKVNLVADKQRKAALNIAIDMNRFYLFGVDGLENYGILNAPNLPAAIQAAATGTGSSRSWDNKTGALIYDDIVALLKNMAARGEGHIDTNTKLKLVVGSAPYANLIKQNSLGNETVIAMIKRALPNLEVVVVPEYDGLPALGGGTTNKIQLIAVDVDGEPTGELCFSEKLVAGRVVPYLSHYGQKFMAGTYGAVVYRPVFVSTMIDV